MVTSLMEETATPKTFSGFRLQQGFDLKYLRYPILIFTVLAIVSRFVSAGTITGHVRAEPRAEVTEDIASGKYESRKYKFMERINYEDLKDFVVYVDAQNLPFSKPSEQPVRVIIQKDGTFNPHVLPVVVGTTVEWPNQDEIYHNVFSMSESKPFDLGIYKSKETKRVKFDKPGRVDVFCSIHTKMNCVVLVLENPYFAVTDKNGNFKIADLPAGTYNLKAWHERLPPKIQKITVPEVGDVAVEFVLSVSDLPQY